MQIIAFLLIGLIVGTIARLLMLLVPGKDPPGMLITTVVVGMAGSLLARLFDWSVAGQVPGIAISVIAAMMLLTAYRMVTYRFINRREIA